MPQPMVSDLLWGGGVFHHGAFKQWKVTNGLRALTGYLWVPAFSDWCKHRPILIHSAAAVCLLIRQLLTSEKSRCISHPSRLLCFFLLPFCTMAPSLLSILNKLIVVHSLQMPRKLDFLQLTTTTKVVTATTAVFFQKHRTLGMRERT